MRGQESKQARSVGQVREQVEMVVSEPAVEGALAPAFEGQEDGKRDDFAGIEFGARVFWDLLHGIIDTTEQLGDKLFGGQAVPPGTVMKGGTSIIAQAAWLLYRLISNSTIGYKLV